MPPLGLNAALFEDDDACISGSAACITGQAGSDSDVAALSTGLRQFGEGLEQLQSKGSEIFLRNADSAAAAAKVLQTSMISNERTLGALRHVMPRGVSTMLFFRR